MQMSKQKTLSAEDFSLGSSSSTSASDLIFLLKQRAPRIAMGIATGQAVWPVIKSAQKTYGSWHLYTVKVPGGPGSDGLYDELHEWILSLLRPQQQKALVAYVPKTRRAMPWNDDYSRRQKNVRLLLRYDGSREQAVTIRGHKVKITITDGSPGEKSKNWRPPEVIFTAKSMAARDAVISEIAEVLETSQKKERAPSFRILNQYDDWEQLDDLPDRSLDSVILPPGQLERITGDLSRFLAEEELYARRSVPWHRGHLYEGPPGTGKTSVARAVACHLGLDIWYLPLADVKKDTSLIKTVMQVSPRSVLLLEDVDVFHSATSREEIGGTTLSGLLNALDGIATPHGLITIMTTNTPEMLDDALIRPGRADLVEHFRFAGPDEISRLIMHWFNMDKPPVLPDDIQITPAEVTEACKQSSSAAEAADRLILSQNVR